MVPLIGEALFLRKDVEVLLRGKDFPSSSFPASFDMILHRYSYSLLIFSPISKFNPKMECKVETNILIENIYFITSFLDFFAHFSIRVAELRTFVNTEQDTTSK